MGKSMLCIIGPYWGPEGAPYAPFWMCAAASMVIALGKYAILNVLSGLSLYISDDMWQDACIRQLMAATHAQHYAMVR